MFDLFRSLFFESPMLLVGVEVVAVAVVLAVYRRRQTAGSRRAIWITLAVCVLLIVVQHSVETDRERIETAIRTMALAIDGGDVPTVGEYIDRDFQDRGLNRQAWLDDLCQRLQRWQIDGAKVGGFRIEVKDGTADASFWASCDWRSGNQSQQGVYSMWRLTFIRRDDGWKLQRVIDAKFGPGGMLDYTSIAQY